MRRLLIIGQSLTRWKIWCQHHLLALSNAIWLVDQCGQTLTRWKIRPQHISWRKKQPADLLAWFMLLEGPGRENYQNMLTKPELNEFMLGAYLGLRLIQIVDMPHTQRDLESMLLTLPSTSSSEWGWDRRGCQEIDRILWEDWAVRRRETDTNRISPSLLPRISAIVLSDLLCDWMIKETRKREQFAMVCMTFWCCIGCC